MSVLVLGVLLDAALTFVCAWVLVALVARLVRRPDWNKVILLVPLVKVVFDAVRGLGADSFVRSAWVGTKADLGRFQIGLGLERPFFPRVSAVVDQRAHDHWYASSAGDLVANAAVRVVGAKVLVAILVMVALVSVGRVARRIVATLAFEHERKRSRMHSIAWPAPLATSRVDVYLDDAAEGAPFTGGFLRPYVCFPRATYDALCDEERQAALAHELAHVARFDAGFFLALSLIGDALWFLPFRGRWLMRIRDASERAADERAVASGTDPRWLSRALVRVAELLPPARPDHGAALAFIAAGSVKTRVLALLDRPPVEISVRRVLAIIARSASALALVHAALFSSFFAHRP